MKDVWQRIDSWLEQNAPAALADLRPGADDERIGAATQQLGVELTGDFRESWQVHDGQEGNARPLMVDWTLLSLDAIEQQWQMVSDMAEAGDFGDDNFGEADGPVKAMGWNPKWIPVLDNGGGDYQCVDLDPADGGTPGQIITWFHADTVRTVVAGSWREYLERFADDLEAGRYVGQDGQVRPADG